MRTPSHGWLKEHEIKGEKGVILFLYVQPGATQNRVQGIFASNPPRLKISVQSPPVDGAANEATLALLAKILAVSKSRIHLLSGATSRQKNIWVAGFSIEDVIHLIP